MRWNLLSGILAPVDERTKLVSFDLRDFFGIAQKKNIEHIFSLRLSFDDNLLFDEKLRLIKLMVLLDALNLALCSPLLLIVDGK